jgi:hypothetical protein
VEGENSFKVILLLCKGNDKPHTEINGREGIKKKVFFCEIKKNEREKIFF